MAKTLLLLLLSILSIKTIQISSASASDTNFIKKSCSATTYPPLCVQSLLPYAPLIEQNPYKLAQTALSVSLGTAQSTRTFVFNLTKLRGLKAREMAAIKDCMEEIDDTVDRLSKSVKELKNAREAMGQDFQWHISNVETWVSAALTDESTCVDGFAGEASDGGLKSSIKARIVNVAQVISNALALIDKFGSKQ